MTNESRGFDELYQMNSNPIPLEEAPMLACLPPELKKLVMGCFVPSSFHFGGDIVTEGQDTDGVYVLA